MSLDPKKTYIPDATQQPFTGLTVDWYNGREIVVYKLTGVTNEIVDNWAELVLQTLGQWPKEKPYLAVHDLSQSGVSLQFGALVNFDMMNIGITIGGRISAESMFDDYARWKARIAVNFNLSLSGQTNRTLMAYLNRDHPSIQYKSFYNRTRCLRWLTTGITNTSEMKALEDQDDE